MKKMSALEAIRKHCLLCFQNSSQGVAECALNNCPLWPYRLGGRPEGIPHRPLKACRAFCVEQCQAGQAAEVETCQGSKLALGPCPLFNFRKGRSPNVSPATRTRHRETALKQGRKPPTPGTPGPLQLA